MSNFFASDSFFSGASSSSDSYGFSLSDYASIKNGSYKKLLQATYKEEEKGDSKTSASKSATEKQTLSAISDSASALKESISSVQKLFETKKDENGREYVDYDEDKMYKAVKDFVDSYNSTVDDAAKADDKGVLRAAQTMVSFTKANEKALSAIGIKVGTDNKLSIDKDDFKDASKARVHSLFKSGSGYAEQISAKASNLGFRSTDAAKKVEKSSSSSTSSALKSISTSSDSSKTLGKIQDAADEAKKSLVALLETGSKSKFNKVTKTDENGKYYMDYDKDSIYKSVKDFVNGYNDLMDQTKDSSTKTIEQARRTLVNYAKANEKALAAAGITIDSDDNLSINESKFKNADMDKVKALFQDSNSFGKNALQQITKIASSAENEASKSNTYNNIGTYTDNFNSGDWYTSSI